MPKLAGVNHQAAIRVFEKLGYQIARQSGHVIMAKGSSVLVIPRANPIKPHTMGSIIRSAGLTIEEFKDLL